MDLDNLPVGEVGEWVSEKHDYLKRYIDVSRAARRHLLQARAQRVGLWVDLGSAAPPIAPWEFRALKKDGV